MVMIGRPRLRTRVTWFAAVSVGAALLAPSPPAAGAAASPGPPGVRLGPVSEVSRACSHGGAEVEAAAGPPAYVYQLWIGCGGIGFARSVDGGRTYQPAGQMRGSAGFSWDPAIAVARDGTVYAAFMHAAHGRMYPVLAASTGHGAAFSRITALAPRRKGNWGDRDFVATGPGGTVYVTWDYGPSAKLVKLLCSRGGSCAYAAGDLNAVIQKSADGGRTFGKIIPLGPNFPRNGGYSAPLVVRPDGRVDVLYVDHPASPRTYKLHLGHEVFTSSPNGSAWPDALRELWPSVGTLSLREWWIDGDISVDKAGTLYVTWDTQTAAGDIGWLSYSADAGATWYRPVRVTPDQDHAPHIVQVAGGRAGVAYVGWLTDASPRGYALWLRPFSVTAGWLSPAIRVSPGFGSKKIWPGDTFGITLLPGHGGQSLALSWGSAVGSGKFPEIWGRTVTLRP